MTRANDEAVVSSTGPLSLLNALAECDASRYAGEDPAIRTSPTKQGNPGRVWVWPVRIGATALLGVVSWVLVPDGAAAASGNSDAIPGSLPIPADVPMRAPPTAAGVATPVRTVDPPRIARERGLWRIRADAASRYEAARELAEMSGTRLPTGIEALRSTRPLDLQWEGRELAQAWQAIIGNEANYALQCAQNRCTAWILAMASSIGDRPVSQARASTVTPVAPPPRSGQGMEAPEPSAYD